MIAHSSRAVAVQLALIWFTWCLVFGSPHAVALAHVPTPDEGQAPGATHVRVAVADLAPTVALGHGCVLEIDCRKVDVDPAGWVELTCGNKRIDSARPGRGCVVAYDTAADRERASSRFAITYRGDDGAQRLLVRSAVELTDVPPCRLVIEHVSRNGVATHLMRAGGAGFKPGDQLQLRLDGKAWPGTAIQGDAPALDASVAEPGEHRIEGAVLRGRDWMCPLEGAQITVVSCVRPVLPTPTKVLRVDPDSPKTKLRAEIGTTLRPRTVSWLLDGWVVARRTEPPFEVVEWNAESAKPGRRRYRVELTTEDGRKFVSAEEPISLVRGSSDASSGPGTRSANATAYDFRALQALARGYPQGGPASTGAVGRVNGLVVHTQVVDGVAVTEYGGVFPVEAELATGSGRVSTSITSGDAQFAAGTDRAATYAKRKGAELGAGIDWGITDIQFRFPGSSSSTSGDSASGAQAIACLSRALGVPVRDGFAMTGAVRIDGHLAPVGGVLFKAAGALQDASIKVLAVPRDRSVKDLDTLFRLDPDLFSSKHVLLVSSMDQVLRHALVGYDPEASRADRRFRDGLRLFGANSVSAALLALDEACRLVPESLTYELWRSAMRAAKGATLVE